MKSPAPPRNPPGPGSARKGGKTPSLPLTLLRPQSLPRVRADCLLQSLGEAAGLGIQPPFQREAQLNVGRGKQESVVRESQRRRGAERAVKKKEEAETETQGEEGL